jgi:hypothetical protein
MALSSAEKQRRYRERHLGVRGSKQRMQLFVRIHAKAQIERLAHYNGYSITKMIEQLALDADRALLDQLPPRRRGAYLDCELKRDTISPTSPGAQRQTPNESRPKRRR